MNLQLLVENLTNPALLFFVLGMIAVRLKSDLKIPPNSAKFISLYLLFSIGFKGGQELSNNPLDREILFSIILGTALALVVPIYTFFILKRKLSVFNAGAIAAAYGSVSAVTFVTAVSFLEFQEIQFGGHMVAVMALMEAPSIVIALLLIAWFNKDQQTTLPSYTECVRHALTNGSVLLVIGSLIIGFLASETQAEGIKPFTTDIFKGFLAVFLLDMGINSGKKLQALLDKGWFTLAFAIVVPLVNGCLIAVLSSAVTNSVGNRLLFSILAASASYIAVPAAMRMAVPKANPGLYIPMALAITFPLNITLGIPLYYSIIQSSF